MKNKQNHEKQKAKRAKIILIIVSVILVIGIVIFFLGNNSSQKVYEVGKDIEAGEYVLVGTGKHNLVELSYGESESIYGYYAICTTKKCEIDSETGINEIITNDNVTGKAYVIVEDGQYLELNNMKLYKVNEYNSTIKKAINYDYKLGYSDYYKVGKDISEGTYTFTGDSFYYSVCTKPSCNILNNEVITNEFNETINGSSTVTLENGQYLIISGTKPFTVTK